MTANLKPPLTDMQRDELLISLNAKVGSLESKGVSVRRRQRVNQMHGFHRLHTIILSIIVLAFLAFGLYYPNSLDRSNVAPNLPSGKLTSAQSKAIDAIVDLSHLMIGWAIALVGATAYFVKASFESTMQKNVVDLYFLFLS